MTHDNNEPGPAAPQDAQPAIPFALPENAGDAVRIEMEELANKIKANVLSHNPRHLLGYMWGLLLRVTNDHEAQADSVASTSQAPQLALEYIHAILSCFRPEQEEAQFDERAAEELIALCEKMRASSYWFAVASTKSDGDGAFGPETGQIEFWAKTSWVSLRGHRYQVLEKEFFCYVLGPHEEALRQAYGVGANEIADGIQQITDSMMSGHSKAYAALKEEKAKLEALAAKLGVSVDDAWRSLVDENPQFAAVGEEAALDLFEGGICNLSRKTALPQALLADLAFERGGNDEFFAPGDFCGTPLRTLPARIRPAVRLDDGYYAPDLSFVRDSAYRAIQWGLQARLPGDRQRWKDAQQRMSEEAFEKICARQLRGARVFKEVYYPHPVTGKWVENDVLVLVDDVLVQLEAKAGAMPMHNPATNFNNHVRAVQQLVTAAYEQTKRFFAYASSAEEVPLFRLREGHYEEVVRLRLSDYRVCIPVGLTVESFSPFSAMCKELPDVEAILGKHPFVSLSIDDLFVLTKLLPGAGEFFHYLSVRQQAAGIRGTMIFDELDHLGFYIKKNRFDVELREMLDQADQIVTGGLSDVVDSYFRDNQWPLRARPRQEAPAEFRALCDALDEARKPGWLAGQALLLDCASDTRQLLASQLRKLAPTLREHRERWTLLSLAGQPAMLFLQRQNADTGLERMNSEAEAFSVMQDEEPVQAFVITYDMQSRVVDAFLRVVKAPMPGSHRRTVAEARSAEMRQKARPAFPAVPAPVPFRFPESASGPALPKERPAKLPRRNDTCWCGSGVKYKKCHLPDDEQRGA
ncbi:SEC-C domain-containing protein [Paraburkholderia ginsengisoli]|uniref:SEC-C domain-containing protein n=1 Tax=Paraburkholderia ginsengisoli TaxID=311231 RepID=A0A7T4T7R1_9BURK|nr:SEC-C domain-containing protein [Paraburkholderia ginsengisoli]QQC63120.1 SEC-C domain-containing protein [Paraburkholderia ginsengisoli]